MSDLEKLIKEAVKDFFSQITSVSSIKKCQISILDGSRILDNSALAIVKIKYTIFLPFVTPVITPEDPEPAYVRHYFIDRPESYEIVRGRLNLLFRERVKEYQDKHKKLPYRSDKDAF